MLWVFGQSLGRKKIMCSAACKKQGPMPPGTVVGINFLITTKSVKTPFLKVSCVFVICFKWDELTMENSELSLYR